MGGLLAQDEGGNEGDDVLEPVESLQDGFEGVVEGLAAQVPEIVLAIVVFVVALLVSRLVARLVKRALDTASSRSDSFSNVISRLVRAAIIIFGLVLALMIAVPDFDLAAVVASLGLTSVALGFAFSDILQNTLAGLLLLFRQPFEVGDQIEVEGYVGTVEAIKIRETSIKQYDGHRVLIPNSTVYGSSIRVQTAHPLVRSVVAIGVDYDSDLHKAREVAQLAIATVDGVADDPTPEVYFTGLGTNTIDLDVRYWTGSRQAEIRAVQDRAVVALTDALNKAGIGMPANIVELDARLSLAEAIRLTQGATGFGGEQNGQSQASPLPGLEGSYTQGRTGGTRAYLTPHELDVKYAELGEEEGGPVADRDIITAPDGDEPSPRPA